MKLKSKMGFAVIILTIAGLSVMFADATISSILMGGKVTVSDLAGNMQYTSNPFST
ncbi:hypothetical protein KAU92_03370 [Candidatus Bathyarchaeota archaeon]|nr:hypothetical protein [Candidatus Bathyarchaeota archaeon]